MPTYGANETDLPGWLEKTYSPEAVTGVSILVVAACLSFVAAAAMLAAIIISSIRTKITFLRTQLGTYFVSLILAELVQATGSAMSIRWIILHKVESGTFCAAQGLIKNAANVSTALWSMIIAFHTFILIFLRIRVVPWVFYTTFASTWIFIGFIVVLGPTALQKPENGPFFGVSGYWCWITNRYETEQFTQEYLFMFIAALVSVILYLLIFLRLRGNIEGAGLRIKLRRAQAPWRGEINRLDTSIERVGKRMLLYPVCYVILVLPIAACRWSKTYGKPVPFSATIFADTVFLLSGVVNAVLYSTTRRVTPIQNISVGIRSWRSGGAAAGADEKGLSSKISQPPLPVFSLDARGCSVDSEPLNPTSSPWSGPVESVRSTAWSGTTMSDIVFIERESRPDARTSRPDSGVYASPDTPSHYVPSGPA